MACNISRFGKKVSNVKDFDTIMAYDLKDAGEKSALQDYIDLARGMPDTFTNLELVLLRTLEEVIKDDTSRENEQL